MSNYSHTIIKHTPLSTYTRHMRLDFHKLRPLYSFPQRHYVTASHPSPGDNPPERGRDVRKNAGPCKNCSVKLKSTYAPGLSTRSNLSHIVSQPPPSFLCCPSSPSHHTSSLTSVYHVPDLRLLPPSTPFWPYGTHPFFPHAQTISILSEHFISTTFTFLLSALLIPHASAPYNAVGKYYSFI